MAHKTALDELDSAQKAISVELQKVSQLQTEKRQFLTLREEFEVEKDARQDLTNENNLIREQLERVVKADHTGSQIWKERETQYRKQIKALEDTIGDDAKDMQKLRLALHQEKINSKRLALKLDETEATVMTGPTIPHPTASPVRTESEPSPIKEVDLNIKTFQTGNRYAVVTTRYSDII